MTAQDDWGRDPSVRRMRMVFNAMERRQARLLKKLGFSRLDPRLRAWRARALSVFETEWARKLQQGVSLDEEQAAALYATCLLRALQQAGGAHLNGASIDELLKEENA